MICIDVKNGTFRSAANCTTPLVGLLYTYRALLLELALPVRAYRTLGYPSRVGYRDWRARFGPIRRRHSIQGTHTPAGYIRRIISRGMKVAGLEVGLPQFLWLDDAQQTFSHQGPRRLDPRVRVLPRPSQRKGRKAAARALLGLPVDPIDISTLSDDFSNRDPGHWVFQKVVEDGNDDSAGSQFMLKLTRSVVGEMSLFREDGGWDWDKVEEYLVKARKQVRMLMLQMHCKGGQPGRQAEIGTIKFRNSQETIRGVMILEDVFFFTQYHKAQGQVGFSYNIGRFLPPDVGQSLLMYLKYIRPFPDFLHSELQEAHGKVAPTDSDSVFCDVSAPHKSWRDALSDILVEETKSVLTYRPIVTSQLLSRTCG